MQNLFSVQPHKRFGAKRAMTQPVEPILLRNFSSFKESDWLLNFF